MRIFEEILFFKATNSTKTHKYTPILHNGMEISAEKTKLITNNTSGINTEVKVNGQKLETITSFNIKYLGSILIDEGSSGPACCLCCPGEYIGLGTLISHN